jgi:hypothetical protein
MAASRGIPKLAYETTPAEGDDAGALLIRLMMASVPNFDDIMLLCCHDRCWRALKLLRVLFERTVTLKYIAQNPAEAEAFIAFDAFDCQQVLSAIVQRYGLKAKPETLQRIEAAAKAVRVRFKQEGCSVCGMRKQIGWTPRSSQELAEKVGLQHLHFEASVTPQNTFTRLITGLRGCWRKAQRPCRTS